MDVGVSVDFERLDDIEKAIELGKVTLEEDEEKSVVGFGSVAVAAPELEEDALWKDEEDSVEGSEDIGSMRPTTKSTSSGPLQHPALASALPYLSAQHQSVVKEPLFTGQGNKLLWSLRATVTMLAMVLLEVSDCLEVGSTAYHLDILERSSVTAM